MKLLFLLVLFATAVFADCQSVNDGDRVSGLVFLCEGSYKLTKGIIMEGNESLLDCRGAVLEGFQNSVGVVMMGDYARVRNCIFRGFRTGIIVKAGKPRIQLNTFEDNFVGIELTSNVRGIIQDNSFVRNVYNVSEGHVEYVAKPIEKNVSKTNVSRAVPKITAKAVVPPSVKYGVMGLEVFVIIVVVLSVVTFVVAEVFRVAKEDPERGGKHG